MSKEGSSRHIVLKISELAYLVDLLDRKLILFDMYRDCNSTRDLLNSGTALHDERGAEKRRAMIAFAS